MTRPAATAAPGATPGAAPGVTPTASLNAVGALPDVYLPDEETALDYQLACLVGDEIAWSAYWRSDTPNADGTRPEAAIGWRLSYEEALAVCATHTNHGFRPRPLPPAYSADIDLAWSLVERLQPGVWTALDVTRSPETGARLTACTMGVYGAATDDRSTGGATGPARTLATARAASAPLALCRAVVALLTREPALVRALRTPPVAE